MEVLRRTFAAKSASGAERARLNGDALTSEYMPSERYLVRSPMVMSDGKPHPQGHVSYTFRTKREALAWVENHSV